MSQQNQNNTVQMKNFEHSYASLMRNIKEIVTLLSPEAVDQKESWDFLPIEEAVEITDLIRFCTLCTVYDLEATKRELKSKQSK